MFITNNDTQSHLWEKKNSVKHQKVSKYYDHDCWEEKIAQKIGFLNSIKDWDWATVYQW